MPEYQLNSQPTQYYTTTGQPVSRVTPGDRPSTPNNFFHGNLIDPSVLSFYGVDIKKEEWKYLDSETVGAESPISEDVVTPMLGLLMIYFAYRLIKNKISKIVGDFGKKH